MVVQAAESANGTYQTEVDRDAIQFEFNQLNDELDQIADTDFNGTVMLNGGTMADGTRPVGGKFDYTSINNKRSALELGPSDFQVGEAKGSIAKDETVTFTYTASTGTDTGKGTWTQVGGTGANFTSKDTGGFVYDGLVFSADTSEFVTGDSVTINLDVSSRANGLNTSNLSLNTQEDANAAIDQIDNAINKVSMVSASFGATQNRLEHKVENLTTTAENLTEAEAGIRDTDMAQEMLNYTKFNVLQQAAQSMLAQANQQPQSILQLLG